MADQANGGYIRLYRKLLENPVWTALEPSVLKVMLAFVLKANWRPAHWYDGRSQILIPRGSFVTSYARIAEFCRLSPKQVRLAFDHLEKLEVAAYKKTHQWTLVTIRNYEAYQSKTDDEGGPDGTIRAEPRHGKGTARAAIEEFNKERKDKPTRIEVAAGEWLFRPGAPTNGRARARAAADPKHDLTKVQEGWWAEFWSEYWLKRGKKEARAAFGKAIKTEALFGKVIAGVRLQKPEMLRREASKRPYGATWLNGERWEDELQVEPTPRQPVNGLGYGDMEAWKKGITA